VSGRTGPVLIPELTGIRFFLAVFVVIFHFGQAAFSEGPVALRNVFASGYTSVSMFFVLSGYVLARSYKGERGARKTKFWIARVARILPAYATAIAVSVPFYLYAGAIGKHLSSTMVLTALTCTHAWFVSSKELWNFPAWSLTCEWFFYALFPFIAAPIARLDQVRLRWAIVGFAVLSMLPPLVYLAWQPDGVPLRGLLQSHIAQYPVSEATENLTRPGTYRLFMYNPISHLPVFLLGVALGRFKVAFGAGQVTRASRIVAHLAIVGMLVLLAVSGSVPHLLMHNSLAAICFCGLMFYADALWKPLSRLLAAPLTVLLGEASYALYILQIPLAAWYVSILRHLHALSGNEEAVSRGWPLAGLVCFLCAGSVLTFVLIERPSRVSIRSALTRWIVTA
jgi:peptidoglycan/LPS O-acetylase OafA/YrhL